MADPQVDDMQKWYAAVMLNMAKVSAAKVLVAEQHAKLLVGEVAAAKNDGVKALVRLKSIMKAKIKKARSHSLAHVENINQLQEQLHDAQNTVATLQVELRRANTELEQTRKTLSEERTKVLPTSEKVDSDKNRGSKRVSFKNKTTVDGICNVPTNAGENGAVENLENLSRSGSALSSLLTRSKKSELYRYGCTQRILAVQQRSRSADSSLEQRSNRASALNSCSKIGKNDTTGNLSIVEQILQTNLLANCKGKRGRRSRPSHRLDSSVGHMKTEDKSSHTSDKNGCLLLLQALEQDLSSSNMFAGHNGEGLTDLKDNLAMGGKDPNICTFSAALKDAHGLSSMHVARRKRSKTIRVFKDGCYESKSVPTSGNTLLGSSNENTVSNSEQNSERMHNSSDTPLIDNTSVSSNGTGNLMLPSAAIENLMHPSDAIENLMHPSAANTIPLMPGYSSQPVLVSTKIQIGGQGKLQIDHPECKTLENISGGSKEVKMEGSSNLASDRADPLIISSLDKEHNANASSGVSIQAAGTRSIKYTFNRRKRKGVPLDTTPQGAVPQKSSSLVSLADKEEPQVKPETEELLEESPEDDSELIVVAQQLLLLSKLKW